jgi:hypothetical protein
MSLCMICSDNQIDSELLNAAIDASSENPDFPVENVQADFPAYKVWRSAGNYVIDDDNDTIVFRDDASTDLLAVIAHGTYTRATLATAALAALNAAGVAVYTVTFNSTLFKWVFTSDQSGGATAFQIRADDVLCTAAAVFGLGDSAYADSSFGTISYTADFISIHTDEWILCDHGTPVDHQAAIIKGRAGKRFGLSSSATIEFQMNETSNFENPEYSETLTWSEFGSYVVADYDTLKAGNGLFEARRWSRWRLRDPANSKGYVEVSKIFAGRLLVFEKGAAQFPFEEGVNNLSQTVKSIGGVKSTNVYPRQETRRFTTAFMTPADKELLQDVYKKYGDERPLFFIFDRNSTLSATPQREVMLMRFVQAPSWVKENAKSFASTLFLEEEL